MPHDPTRSYLAKMHIANFRCIGPEGLDVVLDDIVCLVGRNNTGKSTVLQAYEAAYTKCALSPEDVYTKDPERFPDFVAAPPTVELWVHIPAGAENIDARWKERQGDQLLVRSRWTWPIDGGKPVRETWDPSAGEYATDGTAAGLDEVFNSRLPRPFRIGSLDNPTEEHKRLLELILEPIKARLTELMGAADSPLRRKIEEVQAEAQRPVSEFARDVAEVQRRVNESYTKVFSSSEIRLSISLGDLSIDPGTALTRASRVDVLESHSQSRWTQQGTGSQRALFWSMLEVRSELNRVAEERRKLKRQAESTQKELDKEQRKLGTLKKADAIKRCQARITELEGHLAALAPEGVPQEGAGQGRPSLPGFMLLIDEPETAMHPSAVRAAKDHLYSLAEESGWQVMLSTHHPAFVDPLEDHTTIVRLHRPESHEAPNVYRSDTAQFQGDELELLKALMAFDATMAEMFFADRVIIVEGDTEFAAFSIVMDLAAEDFPKDGRPLILRARGKWTIPPLVRMLTHFRVNFAVLHDVDPPRTKNGDKRNNAYTANGEIATAVAAARDSGLCVIHRHSTPDFEREHGMELESKDKPFSAWKNTQEHPAIRQSVRGTLDELSAVPTIQAAEHPNDGQHFEVKLQAWAAANTQNDPAFSFEAPERC